jgi:dipeptidyl aminopeptidase/acylaminoacyl peptidase
MHPARVLRLAMIGLLLGACAGGPPPPGPAAAPPELLPLHQLFANREANWGYRVSPDGTRVGWIGSHAGRTTILFKTLGTETTGAIDTHSSRSITWFTWARDSRRVLYSQDKRGDENYHVYLASTERPDAPPVDLTPWPGVRAWLARVPRTDRGHVVVGANRRDRTVFDLFRVSLDTGAVAMLAENPGDVVEWMTDRDGRPRARLRHEGAGTRHLEVWRAGEWSRRQTYDLEEWDVGMLGVTPDEDGLWLLSSRGRDRRALVRLDVETGAETVVYQHPRVDVGAALSARTGLPLAAFAEPDYPAIHVFDRDLARDIAGLPGRGPRGIWILSRDDEERRTTVEVYTDRGYEFYLLERDRPPVRLGQSHTHAFLAALAPVTPISLTARDGERLHGYLTRPAGFRAPGPLVLHVHGGHWVRDTWRYDRIVQFFANRGYAVLQVNYRGSSGYGRRFAELAVGEYAGKMHDDLVDAVRWAVREGIADPARVAIHGGSYGGYAALVGMTFTPELFACGVSVVGISNLVTFFDAIPPYWKLGYAPRFLRYVGDPYTPEGRRRLEERSPIFRADRVRGPVLLIHGANDPRVTVRESEQMDAELRRLGKDVRLVVFADEGHRRDYGNWRNAIRHYGEIERFLARCLGGRAPDQAEGS